MNHAGPRTLCCQRHCARRIDNRPGAGGLIGSELTREAAPDGYTLAMVGQPHLSNVLLREKKPYDPLKDYTAISLVGTTHIHFYVYPLPAIMTLLKAGTLRALAVASPKRAEALPDVPTSAEAGFPQFRSESWFGLIAPRALPKGLVARINADTARVLKEPATREKFMLQGAEPGFGPPGHFDKRVNKRAGTHRAT